MGGGGAADIHNKLLVIRAILVRESFYLGANIGVGAASAPKPSYRFLTYDLQ